MGKRKILLILSLLLTLAVPGIVPMAAETGSVPVAMEVSSVYGETAKSGCHIPLSVQIYGQSAAPFSGNLSVCTLESGSDGDAEVYEYRYPVSVSTAERKTMEIYVPLGQKSSEIHLSLTDAAGKEIVSKTLQFDISRDMGRLVIGALSDDVDRLRYLDGVNLNYGMVCSVVIPVEKDSFPGDARGLELFDVLVINDFDMDLLTGEQETAILGWVKRGGTLLVGTGKNAGKTLNGLAETFVELPVLETRFESVSMGTEYSKENPGDSMVDMICVDFEIPGGRDVIVNDGLPLLTMVPCGEGQAGFFVFDLEDVERFAQENPVYPIRLLTEVLGEDTISNLYFYSTYSGEQEYWNAQMLVNTGSADRLPKLPVYTVTVIVYILLIGPGMYLFLKKKDLSRYYGVSVVVLSVVSAAVIYLMGVGTRFTSEFYTCATVLDISDSVVEETSYLNIRTPDSRPFSVGISSEYQVAALTRNSHWDDVPEESFDKRKSWNVGIQYGEYETILAARRSRAFDPRFFKLQRRLEGEFGEGITARLELFNGTISGIIINNLPFTVENAAIISYGQLLPLGTMESGEIREFTGEQLLTWPVGLPGLLARMLAEKTGEEEMSDSDYLKSVERTSLYSYFIERYFENYTDAVRFSAFGPENGLYESFGENGQAVDGRVLYTAKLEVSTSRDGLTCRSGLIQTPEITSGSGTIYGDSMTMYGTDPLAVEYFLGSDIEVEAVSFLPISGEFLNDADYIYLRQFDGEAFFYNNDTKTYDPVELVKQTFSREELSAYLSDDNSLVVKYVGREEDAGVSLSLPIPMVTGRER